jgi:hypothetical protein
MSNRVNRGAPNVARASRAVVVAIALSGPAAVVTGAASPTTSALVEKLAGVEKEVATAPDAQTRMKAAERADQVRAELLATASDDERAATWLADRAAHALDVPASTGLDLVVLLGVPTREQAETVLASAERALDLANRADAAASQAIARLEARLLDRATMPDAAATADFERRLRLLVDVEQTRRIPFLRATARTMIAAASTDADRAGDMANMAIREIKDLQTPGASLAASKHLLMAFALTHAARGDRAQDILRAAQVQFENALILSGPGVDPAIPMRARLGLVRIGAEKAGAAEAIDAASVGLSSGARKDLKVLLTEARAADALMRARLDPTRKVEFVSRAVRWLASTSPTADEVSLGEPDRRPTVQQKIAEIVPRGVSLGALPAEAAFATAVTNARSLSVSDTNGRAEAAAMFQSVAQRMDAPSELRSQARWERAVVIAQGSGTTIERTALEIDALADVLSSDPLGDYAYPAARRIVEVFVARSGAGDTPGPSGLENKSEAVVKALRLLMAREASDRWGRESAHLAAFELRRGAPGAVERAGAFIDVIPDPGARAEAARLTSATLARKAEEQRTLLTKHPDAAAASGITWKSLAQKAAVLSTWAEARDPSRTTESRVLLGEAQFESGDSRASETLAKLDDAQVGALGISVWTRWKFALARVQQAQGDLARAFGTLREITLRLEGEPGQSARESAYWRAWAQMLTIMESMNTDGSRTSDIRAQIKRLELIDRTLGGGPDADIIRAIQSRLGDGADASKAHESRTLDAPP